MELKEVKINISKIRKKLDDPIYKIENVFELKDNHKKKLLDDFNLVTSLIFELNKTHKKLRDWWNKDGETFESGFSYFWLSQYTINLYLEALGSNRLIDTFLNDNLNGKNGVLANFRERILKPDINLKLKNTSLKAEKIKKCKEIINEYPISIKASLISFRKLLKYRTLQLILPLQIFIANLLPHRSWWFKKKEYITEEQLNDLEPYLETGDILLQRTNYQITNMTLPGFWTHTMIYDGNGKIIESTPGKVKIGPWKKTAKSDYLCVLRTRFVDKEKQNAVEFAKSQIGKPYDFNFDFLSDKALICSELILKSYPKINPSLISIFGRYTFPSSEFIKLISKNKIDFVYFLDGRQKSNRAILGTKKELIKTYMRSKWDIVQK